MRMNDIAERVISGTRLSLTELEAAAGSDLDSLLAAAARVRDTGFGHRVTYSRKVFIPLTELCRDVCHYCTFAKAPRRIPHPFMSVDAVLDVARRGRTAGCNEALFTLGEKPEMQYEVARRWLDEAGFGSTIEYLAHVAGMVLRETGLLPHINAGTLAADELAALRTVSASMGIMLETSSERLSARGMPHFGSPDKAPAERLATLRRAGELSIPMTSGLLVGIGETIRERLESLIALRDIHDIHGNLQEVIVQNFRAKPGTKMASHPEPSDAEFLRTVALARLAFGSDMSIQAPPNLSPQAMPALVSAGINDWGGVSPVTPDHVNPEAPWPHLERLAEVTASSGKRLVQRLTIYPQYIDQRRKWLDAGVAPAVLRLADAEGLARECMWRAGGAEPPPADVLLAVTCRPAVSSVDASIARTVERGAVGERLCEADIARLFETRGAEQAHVMQAADRLRHATVGDTISYVVTRNINYTNVCYFKCTFCAFSKGKTHESLRGKPYDLDLDEIVRRAREAWDRGATEVCLQGGIHPDYTGQTYIDICETVTRACPGMHVHAFSPLEVSQGASTLGLPLAEYLNRLKEAGLGTLPGTAAEILDDEVRSVLCPDKLNTQQWLSVLETAHKLGLKTTSTIMYGHVDRPVHWARHLLRLRDLQARTGGITEFVPLPFVAQEAPLYLRGGARPGPTFREAVLMHSVARLALHPHITNIQASWVKMGPAGVKACLQAGANDLGGTLMNETITRAAGAVHGQEAVPETLEGWIRDIGRTPRQRTTLYGDAPQSRQLASYQAAELSDVVNTPLRRRTRVANVVAAE